MRGSLIVGVRVNRSDLAFANIGNLVEDAQAGLLEAKGPGTGADGLLHLLDKRGVRYTTWHGWELLEAYEKALGAAEGRERIKVVERETMTAISRDEPHDGKLY